MADAPMLVVQDQLATATLGRHEPREGQTRTGGQRVRYLKRLALFRKRAERGDRARRKIALGTDRNPALGKRAHGRRGGQDDRQHVDFLRTMRLLFHNGTNLTRWFARGIAPKKLPFAALAVTRTAMRALP